MRLPPPPQITGLPTELMAEAVARVFEGLTRVIGYLDVLAEPRAPGDRPDPALAAHLYTTLQAESLVLIDFIELQLLTDGELPPPLHSALDAVCFAVRHEMRRAFPGGAAGEAESLDTPGILRNCFQQSYLILAKLFNPALEGRAVFDSMQERREQSLVLWEDLVELIGAVREAKTEAEPSALTRLQELLEQFRAGSLRHLKSSDWATFEAFADGLKACRRPADAGGELHRFDCYLELLLNHVRMRSALNDVRG